jgi:hypothetical protein
MRFACLSESFSSSGAVTPIGLACNLFVVGHRRAEAPMDSTLRPPHRRPCPAPENGDDPLSGFGSSTEFHPHTTANVESTEADRHACPFRGLVPYSVFPAEQSHLPPAIPNPPVTMLRPQGFSPSRRFAPRSTCRACFIPVPLLGFSLRGLHPTTAPYVLSNAGTLMRFSTQSEDPVSPLQGFTHAVMSPPAKLGV